MRRVLVCSLVALLAGCATIRRALDFEQQLTRVRQQARIEGLIRTELPARGTLVVVLARVQADGTLTGVDTFVRVNPGSYAFPVAPGRYQVGAYEDANHDGLLDPGERTADVRESPVLEVAAGESASHDILLAADATTPPSLTGPVDVLGIVARTPREQRQFSLWAWSVVGGICQDLSDPDFGPEGGQRGLWEIMDFLNDGLAGIYFLEPFDPDRVPVLFVHGIGGHPQQLAPLMDSLDRNRFQPWFLYYPSGFGLRGLARYTAVLLSRLEAEHGFDEIAIVAHSMGGLVARGAILEYAEGTGRDDVRLFVSISTPWGGAEGAEKSTRAPIELPPSFADMRPGSEYLQWLFYRDADGGGRRALPRPTAFHLLFGFRMGGSSARANDGSVTVASQMRREAQEEAASIRGYDRGHVEMLGGRDVLARVNQLLAERF